MKRIAVVLAATAALMAPCVYAMGPRDQIISLTDEFALYFDPSTVKTRNARLTAWLVSDLRNPGPAGEISTKELTVMD